MCTWTVTTGNQKSTITEVVLLESLNSQEVQAMEEVFDDISQISLS